MFILRDMARSILRNKGRSLLMACIALCLMACMGVYLGTAEKNKAALSRLSEALPVTVKVVNGDGSAEVGLGISPKLANALLNAGVREPVCTAQMSGNLEEFNLKYEDKSSDTGITGANTLDAFGENFRDSLILAEGWEECFLAGSEPVCVADSGYAQRHGVQVGDTLEMPVYWFKYDKSGLTFRRVRLAKVQLTVIGTYQAGGEAGDMVVPIGWMRELFEAQGVAFSYGSLRCVVEDALRLNDFKAAAEAGGFHEVMAQVTNPHTGNALLVEDKIFIGTARRLQSNIQLFALFRAPFFVLLTGLIALSAFLTCRGRQTELAIEASLGKPRFVSGAGIFLENMLLCLLGLAAAGALLWLGMGLEWGQVLSIALAFLGCAAVGVFLSVCLLTRFDPLALLTRTE